MVFDCDSLPRVRSGRHCPDGFRFEGGGLPKALPGLFRAAGLRRGFGGPETQAPAADLRAAIRECS